MLEWNPWSEDTSSLRKCGARSANWFRCTASIPTDLRKKNRDTWCLKGSERVPRGRSNELTDAAVRNPPNQPAAREVAKQLVGAERWETKEMGVSNNRG
jgi:hypothetical protein